MPFPCMLSFLAGKGLWKPSSGWETIEAMTEGGMIVQAEWMKGRGERGEGGARGRRHRPIVD